jgi:hypothetical protein
VPQVVDAEELRESRKRLDAAREKKIRAKAAIILFEGRRLNGNLIILRIVRRAKDELTFLCYLPESSLRFEKVISEEMVRDRVAVGARNVALTAC